MVRIAVQSKDRSLSGTCTLRARTSSSEAGHAELPRVVTLQWTSVQASRAQDPPPPSPADASDGAAMMTDEAGAVPHLDALENK